MENDLFQNHSRRFLEMALGTDRRERLSNPDGYGKRTGDCGDTVEFFLKVTGQDIISVAYDTNGCLNTNACANTVAELVEGKSINAAWEITPDDVAAYLETLPPDHFHCAELAVGAFYLALSNWRTLQRDPWKKAYGRL